MKSLFLKTLHWLSLDVVIGAIISNIMFWKLPDGQGKVNAYAVAILGTTTWLIYLLDRLLDIRKNPQNQTIRHQFHKRFKKHINKLFLVLLMLCCVLLFFLPKQLIIFGVLLALLVGIYLFALNFFELVGLKEPVVAVVYVLAVVGSAYVMKVNISSTEWVLGLNFLMIAFQNLLLFSLFETYQKPKIKNIVVILSKKGIDILSILIFLWIFSSLFMLKNQNLYTQNVAIIELIMSAILLIIRILPKVFFVEERYRWIGDAVFCLPIFLVFFA